MSGGGAQAYCWLARALLVSAKTNVVGCEPVHQCRVLPASEPDGADGRQERERSTLRYIMAKVPFEKEAMAWLANMTDPPASSSEEFVFTEGIKIHRPVWDEAHRVTQVRGIGSPRMTDARGRWLGRAESSYPCTQCEVEPIQTESLMVLEPVWWRSEPCRTASWTSRRHGR